jgi:hypothetical protein
LQKEIISIYVPKVSFIILEDVENLFIALIKLSFNRKSFKTTGLLDTSATLTTDRLIDIDLAQKLSKKFGLPLQSMGKAKEFRAFDGIIGEAARFLFVSYIKVFNHQ